MAEAKPFASLSSGLLARPVGTNEPQRSISSWLRGVNASSSVMPSRASVAAFVIAMSA